MARYIFRRILIGIPILFFVVTAVFFAFRLIPGDAARIIAGDEAPQERVEQIRRDLGLDRPAIVQYGAYLADLVARRPGHLVLVAASRRHRDRQPLLEHLQPGARRHHAGHDRGHHDGGDLGAVPRPGGRPRRHPAGAAGHLDPRVLAGAADDAALLGRARLAAGGGLRHVEALRHAHHHPVGLLDRLHHPHDALLAARDDPTGLRPHRPRQGCSRAAWCSSCTRCATPCCP